MDATVRVSGRLTVGSCVNFAKNRLQSAEEVQLHAVGFSILTALKAATRLEELKYVSSSSFSTETVTEDGKPLFKVVVRLVKSPEFDRVSEEFAKSKQVT